MAPISLRPSTIETKLQKLGVTPRNVLVVCGEALRKSGQKESARAEETDRALLGLSLQDAAQALLSVSAKELVAELNRAGNEAFEAAFAEDQEERQLFAESAATALRTRDSAASLQRAAHRRVELARGDVAGLEQALASLQTVLAEVDQRKNSMARMLTGINPERRQALAELDAGEAEQAWWFALSAEPAQDGLLRELGDIETSNAAPLPRFDASSALRRTSLGTVTQAESALLAAHAAKDASLAEALELVRTVDVEALSAEAER